MASSKKNDAQGPQNTSAAAAGDEFDWSKFLPAGHKAEDLIAIGGLTPIYIPETAMAEGFPPVYGWVDRIEYLPEQLTGKDNAYTPVMLRVTSEINTKAVTGPKDDRKTIDIKVGDDVLVPVTGNMKTNLPLQQCATDLDTIHCMGFRVVETRDIGRGNDMWVWDVRRSAVSKPREGRYAFPHTHAVLDSKKALTSSGAAFNTKTGELQDQKSS